MTRNLQLRRDRCSLCGVLTSLRHRARAATWLSYLLMLSLLFSGIGLPMPMQAAQTSAGATHCQQHDTASPHEKSAAADHDCCNDSGCVCGFLSQTTPNNLSLDFGSTLPPSTSFARPSSPHLPKLAVANPLRPPIA